MTSEVNGFPHDKSIYLRAALSAVLLACIVNGLSIRIVGSIYQQGMWQAVEGTFGISVIVWFSLYNCCRLFLRAEFAAPDYRDAAAMGIAIVLMLFPLPSASWVGLTLLSGVYLLKPGSNEDGHRLFILLATLAGSMQWARWISQIFMPTILEIDAILVSSLSGYARYGNLVQSSDASTTLEILEACSSFQNVSLAVLAWVNARCFFCTRGLRRGAVYLTLMVASVVLINTTRIALIAYRPDLYELIHGSTGAFVANTLSFFALLSLAVIGAKK